MERDDRACAYVGCGSLTFETDRAIAVTGVLAFLLGMDLSKHDTACLEAMAAYLDKRWSNANQMFKVCPS